MQLLMGASEMTTVRLKGASARNWFAEQFVKEYGADEAIARERTCGPMLEAIEQVIADMKSSATNGAADNSNEVNG